LVFPQPTLLLRPHLLTCNWFLTHREKPWNEKLQGFLLALNTHRMKILCRTFFDCTFTGVTGHYRASEIPFQDRAGKTIKNQQDWNRSRNQQRNWETLLQIIGLRTQPQDLTIPTYKDGIWEFEFKSESESVFEIHGNPDTLAGLKSDCEGVPMMLNLQEQPSLASTITTEGDNQNIWFSTVNNTLE